MKHIISGLSLIVLFSFLFSCHEEESRSPDKGKVTFSPATVALPGGRVKETTTPAAVLLSIKDSHGDETVNVKLTLTAFGPSYTSEHLELETGEYQLTQFQVLDADNRTLYAAPLEGSEMAEYVDDPLPLNFTVTTEGVQITPEVLAVSENLTPELFGYAGFGFEVVNVSILQIPLAGAEEVTKVSYQLKHAGQTISAEVAPTGTVLVIDNPDFLNHTWETTITVWTRPANPDQKYTKVYRYTRSLTFTGSVVRLPVLTNSQHWTAYYHSSFARHNVQMFVPVDPRHAFQVEVSMQEPFVSVVDRDYYDGEGESICDMSISDDELGIAKDGIWVATLALEDDNNCDVSNSPYVSVNSFVSFRRADTQDMLQYLLTWEIVNGVVTAYTVPN